MSLNADFEGINSVLTRQFCEWKKTYFYVIHDRPNH